MWIKVKRLTNAATAAYGLLGFGFERPLGFAHQASSPVISQKLDGLLGVSAATLIEPIGAPANRLA